MRGIRARLAAAGFTGAMALAGTSLYFMEGEVREVYLDVGGVATVCMGATQRIPEGKTSFTEHECTEIFKQDVQEHLDYVKGLYPGQDIPDSVLAAMTSVSYNVGKYGYRQSPMHPLVQAGAYEAACKAITAPWRTSKGVALGYRATVNLQPHRGLENRRAKEEQLCLQFLE